MEIRFKPLSSEFEDATKQYSEIWEANKQRILSVWEDLSGLKFEKEQIEAIVFEGISRSHPLKLRASYPVEVKRSILIHELGHRLVGNKDSSSSSLEIHKTLFLRLFDVLESLYGTEFADRAVIWEKENLPKEVYEAAWVWAFGFSKDEREKEFKKRIGGTR